MCLLTRWKNSKITKKPITCYKLLATHYDDLGQVIGYETPYMGTFVDDVIEGETILEAKGYQGIAVGTYGSLVIDSGFIHCYTAKKFAFAEAVRLLLTRSVDTNQEIFIFKCEIPSDSEYYRSCPTFKEICSPRIKFVQLIKRLKYEDVKI